VAHLEAVVVLWVSVLGVFGGARVLTRLTQRATSGNVYIRECEVNVNAFV